jgi:hypothetical protein
MHNIKLRIAEEIIEFETIDLDIGDSSWKNRKMKIHPFIKWKKIVPEFKSEFIFKDLIRNSGYKKSIQSNIKTLSW